MIVKDEVNLLILGSGQSCLFFLHGASRLYLSKDIFLKDLFMERVREQERGEEQRERGKQTLH